MTVALVAAVARNGVIGADGEIPWRLPGEQRQFKDLTLGHVLVMGRRTYDAIGHPLPGRTTIVVTRQPGWVPPGGRPDNLRVVGDLDAALALARRLDEHVFVAGGAQIYAQALARADAMVISWVDREPEGDTCFPEVDWSQWREASRVEHDGWTQTSYQRIR